MPAAGAKPWPITDMYWNFLGFRDSFLLHGGASAVLKTIPLNNVSPIL
jgi:hypothetical protein